MHYGSNQFVIHDALSAGQCFKYNTTDMGHSVVSELWSHPKFQSELKKWDKFASSFPQPILINAPPGAGKTTFVREYLAPFAKERGRSVLLLSNRHALDMQTKEKLSDGPAFSTDALQEISRFGNIVVGTYQSIDNLLSMLRSPSTQGQLPMGYVVLDEIHFLTSDAVFNAWTSNCLAKILLAFPACQRFYLSATPQEVKDIIAYEEWRLYQWYKPQNIFTYLPQPVEAISEYLFQADYSYLRLHFCDRLEDMIPRIRASKSKWLIFVSRKSDGKDLADKLKREKIGGEVLYVDSDNRSSNSEVSRKIGIMVQFEKFKERVLISTSVLDCGINFFDDKLENIVVDSADPIQIKQMVGRKRRDRDHPDSPVNVYVVRHTQAQIQQYYRDAQDKARLLEDFQQNPRYFIQNRWPTLTEEQHHLFAVDTSNCSSSNGFAIYVNEYARYKLDCQMKHYRYLDGKIEIEGEGAFEREVASWFGMDSGWAIVDDVEAELREKITAAIEQYKLHSAETDGDAVAALDDQLWELVQPLRDKYKIKHDSERRGQGVNIRNIMKTLELPYDIKKSGKNWSVIDVPRAEPGSQEKS